MKGTIVCCLRDMVMERYGTDAWDRILEASGLPAGAVVLSQDDFPDEKVMRIIGNLCRLQKISIEDAATAFGEYWCVTYSSRVYKGFYLGVVCARDFLKRMNTVHEITTKTMNKATPPKFFYEQTECGSLIMTYQSRRNLMPIFIGLIKGVGKYFNEELRIEQSADNKVEIFFPPGK